MEVIIEYNKDEKAVSTEESYVVTKRGRKRPRKITVDWKLLVQWKDNPESWINLKYMKEPHPVEFEYFAKARGIDHEPDFSWWVTYNPRNRDVILSAVKKFTRKTTHKYCI